MSASSLALSALGAQLLTPRFAVIPWVVWRERAVFQNMCTILRVGCRLPGMTAGKYVGLKIQCQSTDLESVDHLAFNALTFAAVSQWIPSLCSSSLRRYLYSWGRVWGSPSSSLLQWLQINQSESSLWTRAMCQWESTSHSVTSCRETPWS